MKLRGILLLGCALVSAAAGGVEDTFDYFVNNWNVVGLPDYFHGSRITPNNELYLAGGTAVRIRVGSALAPLSRAQGKRAREGWLPIIETSASDGPVRYDITFWATPLPDARDWQKAFGWPTEGENYLNWITVKATNGSGQPAAAVVEVRPDPAGWVDQQAALKIPVKHAREYHWKWNLAPGQSAEGVARYTYFPTAPADKYDHAGAGMVVFVGRCGGKVRVPRDAFG